MAHCNSRSCDVSARCGLLSVVGICPQDSYSQPSQMQASQRAAEILPGSAQWAACVERERAERERALPAPNAPRQHSHSIAALPLGSIF
eukprot:4507782-Alexandrium_andersonii.AAC.1